MKKNLLIVLSLLSIGFIAYAADKEVEDWSDWVVVKGTIESLKKVEKLVPNRDGSYTRQSYCNLWATLTMKNSKGKIITCPMIDYPIMQTHCDVQAHEKDFNSFNGQKMAPRGAQQCYERAQDAGWIK